MPLDGPRLNEPAQPICAFNGKRRYATKADGKVALAQARRNPNHHRRGRREQRVVFCDGCLGYHLTSATRRR